MSDHRDLRNDIVELKNRLSEGMVCLTARGKVSVRATAHAIPTLAERGMVGAAHHLAEHLADYRDEEGGWDDPWSTIFALEAYVGLMLRGVPVDGSEDVIRYAVKVLRSAEQFASPRASDVAVSYLRPSVSYSPEIHHRI